MSRAALVNRTTRSQHHISSAPFVRFFQFFSRFLTNGSSSAVRRRTGRHLTGAVRFVYSTTVECNIETCESCQFSYTRTL